MNDSTEGDCKEDLHHMRLVDLYAPQGVDLGELAPSHTDVRQLSSWPELHAM